MLQVKSLRVKWEMRCEAGEKRGKETTEAGFPGKAMRALGNSLAEPGHSFLFLLSAFPFLILAHLAGQSMRLPRRKRGQAHDKAARLHSCIHHSLPSWPEPRVSL